MHRVAMQIKGVPGRCIEQLCRPRRCWQMRFITWVLRDDVCGRHLAAALPATVMLEGGFAQSRGVGSRALPLGSSSQSSPQSSGSGRRRCKGVRSDLATGSTMPYCLLYGTTLSKSARCGLLSRTFSQRNQGLVPVRSPVRAHKKASRDSELRAVYRTAWSGAVSG
jgi:hypothetical protein